MNKRFVIASALAAAIAAPLSCRPRPGPLPRRLSRPRSATGSPKPARTTAPRPVTTRAPARRRRMRIRVDLRAGGLLRAHRQRQPDAEGVAMRGRRHGGEASRAPRRRRVATAASRGGGGRRHRRHGSRSIRRTSSPIRTRASSAPIAPPLPDLGHTVGVSVGSADGPRPRASRADSTLVDELDPILVSGHLAWSTHRGAYLNDLLPLPYDDERCASSPRTRGGAGRPGPTVRRRESR